MRKHKIKSDEALNPQLADQVQTLRGGMVSQAQKHPLPAQFTVKPHPKEPSMIITNTLNGKKSIVPLFGYGSVRIALNELL